jgi:hypothetical protein
VQAGPASSRQRRCASALRRCAARAGATSQCADSRKEVQHEPRTRTRAALATLRTPGGGQARRCSVPPRPAAAPPAKRRHVSERVAGTVGPTARCRSLTASAGWAAGLGAPRPLTALRSPYSCASAAQYALPPPC